MTSKLKGKFINKADRCLEIPPTRNHSLHIPLNFHQKIQFGQKFLLTNELLGEIQQEAGNIQK